MKIKLCFFSIMIISQLIAQTIDLKNKIEKNYTGGNIELSKTSLFYDITTIEESRIDSFFIYNTGSGELRIDSIYSITEYFKVSQFKGIINSLDSIKIIVTFLPAFQGAHEGTIMILSDDNDEPTSFVDITGIYKNKIQRISTSDSILSFNTITGTSDTLSLFLNNIGDSLLTIEDISSGNPRFISIIQNNKISPGEYSTLEVIFSPITNGKIITVLSIHSNDPIAPYLNIQLIGESFRKFYVPDDFPTIKDAIDNMINGDSLIVGPGIYQEQINITNKNIKIVSNYQFSGNPIDIDNTVIRGDGSRSNLVVKDAKDSTCSFSGFTIINGGGDEGGGLHIDNSVLKLSDLKILKNSAMQGGGIYSINSNIKIYNIVIDSNQAYEGGGIYCQYSNLKLNNVILSENGIIYNISDAGGGIFVSYGSSINMENCLITGNETSSLGGGIYSDGAILNIKKCSFIKNKVSESGGAIRLSFDSKAYIKNSIFEFNESEYEGGAIFNMDSYLSLENSIISNNKSKFFSGGIGGSESGLELVNVTICKNQANVKGGGLDFSASINLVLINSIIYYNNPSQVDIVETFGSKFNVAYSLIPGGFNGILHEYDEDINWLNGNIDANPNFVNYMSDDFSLKDNSPCIGAGISSIEIDSIHYDAPEYDYYNNIRPSPAGSNPDIGAIENILGVSTALEDQFNSRPVVFALNQNFPNPFNPVTQIKLSIDQPAKTSLIIYNTLGEKVTVLLNEFKAAGEYQIKFDASKLASGIYFYYLQAGSKSSVRKMILIK